MWHQSRSDTTAIMFRILCAVFIFLYEWETFPHCLVRSVASILCVGEARDVSGGALRKSTLLSHGFVLPTMLSVNRYYSAKKLQYNVKMQYSSYAPLNATYIQVRI